jgi:hypothetical protein
MAFRSQYYFKNKVNLFFNFFHEAQTSKESSKCEGTLMVNLSMWNVVSTTIFHLERHMGPSYLKPTFTFKNHYLVDYHITYIEMFCYYF